VLYVKDLDEMANFYVAVVGLTPDPATDPDTDDFRILTSVLWELTLVRIPTEVAATFEVTSPPARRADTPMKLSFEVSSLSACQEAVARTKGRVDPDDAVWRFRGSLHLDVIDPEGNVLQLLQSEPG
jgi:catechol 2,3-dioxygenase-like lactoylglutathione lyase family enzyme